MKRFLCVLLVALALVGLMTTVASAENTRPSSATTAMAYVCAKAPARYIA